MIASTAKYKTKSDGWKPSGAAVAALVVAALALAGATCWLTGINPLPTTGQGK